MGRHGSKHEEASHMVATVRKLRTGKGWGYFAINLQGCPHDPLPQARLCVLKAPQPSKIALPDGDWVSNTEADEGHFEPWWARMTALAGPGQGPGGDIVTGGWQMKAFVYCLTMEV